MKKHWTRRQNQDTQRNASTRRKNRNCMSQIKRYLNRQFQLTAIFHTGITLLFVKMSTNRERTNNFRKIFRSSECALVFQLDLTLNLTCMMYYLVNSSV